MAAGSCQKEPSQKRRTDVPCQPSRVAKLLGLIEKIGKASPNEVHKRRGTGTGYGKMSHMSILNTYH